MHSCEFMWRRLHRQRVKVKTAPWKTRKILHIVTGIMFLSRMVPVFNFFASAQGLWLPRLSSFRCVFSHIFAVVFICQCLNLLSHSWRIFSIYWLVFRFLLFWRSASVRICWSSSIYPAPFPWRLALFIPLMTWFAFRLANFDHLRL